MGQAWIVLAIACAVMTAPGTLELLLVNLGALLPRRRRAVAGDAASSCGRIVVVVPAHDEERSIGACLRSLQAAIEADGQAALVVVADHCADATAAIAAAAGARVLVRSAPGKPGKGFALHHAWQQLRVESFGALAVVDADTVVEPDFIVAIRRHLERGADGVQVRNLGINPGDSIRTRLLSLGLLAINVVRPLGRDRLGLSAGLTGNGFAVRRETLETAPFSQRSITEDLEYHLRLVMAGCRVRFVDSSAVWSRMPVTGREAVQQRARWEGGRLNVALRWTPRLLRGLVSGRWELAEPLLDLLLLPLAYHAALLVLTVMVPWTPGRYWGGAGLAVVALHVGLAAQIGGRLQDLSALPAAPFYLAWKLVSAGRILASARPNAAWNRAQRGNGRARPDPPA